MNISLTAPLEALIHEKVSSGSYNNASEVVREALRIMHERDQRDAAKLERLRTEAANGFESMDRASFQRRASARYLMRRSAKKEVSCVEVYATAFALGRRGFGRHRRTDS